MLQMRESILSGTMCTQTGPNTFQSELNRVQAVLSQLDEYLLSYLFDNRGYDYTRFEGGHVDETAPSRLVVTIPFRSYLFLLPWTVSSHYPTLDEAIQAQTRCPRDKTIIYKAYTRYNLDGLQMFWNRRSFEFVVELSHA